MSDRLRRPRRGEENRLLSGARSPESDAQKGGNGSRMSNEKESSLRKWIMTLLEIANFALKLADFFSLIG
jgi:hypothetical protein